MKNKVLIIEDQPSLSGALKDKFIRAGFRVLIAEDGKKGLKAALKDKPDIIILDILMPFMDGLTMLGKLREDPWGEKVKVIMLTNISEPDLLTQSLTKSAVKYLVKSDWTINDVVKKVKKELRK
jgi:two-component system alkaline phosphatase synthesis response regulator PhoP